MLSSVIILAIVFGSLMGGAISQLFGFKAIMCAGVALTAIGFCFFRVGIRRKPLFNKTYSVHEENKNES